MRTHLLVSLVILCYGKYSQQTPQAKVEELIKKRNLRSVGYTHFDVSHLHETGADDNYAANRVTSDILRRRKRDVYVNGTGSNDVTTFHINAHGNSFTIDVKHTEPVLHPQATVLFSSNGQSEVWKGTNPDCFMIGKLTSHDEQTAVFSFCDNLKGFFSDNDHTYWVESLESYDSSHDASSRILVARKPGKPNLPSMTLTEEELEEPRKAISKRADMLEGLAHHRQKRMTKSESIEVEIAVVVDELATAYISEGGATKQQERVELMTMKWTGVKAEYENPGAFVYTFGSLVITIDVVISVKAMEFWDTNPNWITTSTNLLTYLGNFCQGVANQGLYTNFDHVHLITGLKGTDVAGKAYVGDVCNAKRKCAVSSLPDPTAYWVEEHELGHNLNMIHDYEQDDTTCKDPYDGIMGDEYSGWSHCSALSLYTLITEVTGKAACLKQTNVDQEAIQLGTQWPGMLYTDDEVCALRNRPGWRYRSKPLANPKPCPAYTCIDMNPGSRTYGTMRGTYSDTIMGRRCGNDMYCYIDYDTVTNICITWAETKLDDNLKTVVEGGWSAWGPESSCSRTCGVGVRFRQRTCNNPKPQHSDWCADSEYDASLCNIDPCPTDDASPATLITQRATETCTWLNENGLLGKTHENTGTKYSNNEHGQCEVKCDLKSGETTDIKRFGLMPDGTPCTHDNVTYNMFDLYNLPRRLGRQTRCLQGYCYVFGCDSKTGTVIKYNDGCGVCGGTGNSCTITEGTFTAPLVKNERAEIVTIPAGAVLIQVWFDYSSNPKHWIELWTSSNVAVIAPEIPGDTEVTDNLANPTSYAGTQWSYLSTGQFLFADGPTNESVKIKVYFTGTGTNNGINYAYSISKGKPGTPYDVAVINTSAISAIVEWSPGYNGELQQTFHIQFRKAGENVWRTISVTQPNNVERLSHTIEGLKPATCYLLIVYASNDEGNSNKSDIFPFCTNVQGKDDSAGCECSGDLQTDNKVAIVSGCMATVIAVLCGALVFLLMRHRQCLQTKDHLEFEMPNRPRQSSGDRCYDTLEQPNRGYEVPEERITSAYVKAN